MVDLAVEDDAATQAGTHHDDHCVPASPKRPCHQLGKRRAVAIILDAHATAQRVLKIDLEIGPHVVLVRTTRENRAGRLIHLAAITDGDPTLRLTSLLVKTSYDVKELLMTARTTLA